MQRKRRRREDEEELAARRKVASACTDCRDAERQLRRTGDERSADERRSGCRCSVEEAVET